jgi:glycosyltransferase involved in cell wall biosynthesis
MPAISVVIPAYNEGQRIGATLERVLEYAAEERWDAEIVVVNDGSRDNTAALVREAAARNPAVRLIENPGNRGKGYTVRNGMLNATGDLLLFTDADLSSPIEESARLFAALNSGADVAIGSRWLQRELQTLRQPWYRQIFGRAFNLFLRTVLGLSYKDTQCGFKAFKRGAAHAIFSRQLVERWGFDPEVLFLARKLGLRTDEVAVRWAHDRRTKISFFRDGMRMVVEVLKVRMNDLAGRYDQPALAVATPQVERVKSGQ